jgi:TRAP-type C4-dicarboxylate transport system permease small subunit
MEKFNSLLFKIEKVIGQIMLAALLILIVINIILRYMFNMPLFWSEEISNALFIWMGFIGMAYAQGNSSLIALTTLSDKFSGTTKKFVDLFNDLIIAAVVITMFYYSITVWPYLMITPALKIHEGFIYICVPISFGLMIVHQLLKITGNLVNIKMSRTGKGGH